MHKRIRHNSQVMPSSNERVRRWITGESLRSALHDFRLELVEFYQPTPLGDRLVIVYFRVDGFVLPYVYRIHKREYLLFMRHPTSLIKWQEEGF